MIGIFLLDLWGTSNENTIKSNFTPTAHVLGS